MFRRCHLFGCLFPIWYCSTSNFDWFCYLLSFSSSEDHPQIPPSSTKSKNTQKIEHSQRRRKRWFYFRSKKRIIKWNFYCHIQLMWCLPVFSSNLSTFPGYHFFESAQSIDVLLPSRRNSTPLPPPWNLSLHPTLNKRPHSSLKSCSVNCFEFGRCHWISCIGWSGIPVVWGRFKNAPRSFHNLLPYSSRCQMPP
jgi:hypothetical protein